MEEYQIIKFENEKISLDVRIEPNQDTVWLSKDDIALLFNRDRAVLSKHIKNIFAKENSKKKAHVQKMHVRLTGKYTI